MYMMTYELAYKHINLKNLQMCVCVFNSDNSLYENTFHTCTIFGQFFL